MDYFLTIWPLIVFLENRIQEDIGYAEIEKVTGYSLAHVRDIFVKTTGIPLSRYILGRKIANAAYEILHNQQSVLAVAAKYGFSNHDTFTRAFKRITELTPTEFRKKRPSVGRIKLCAGMYGIDVKPNKKKGCWSMNNKSRHERENSVILYGISKVEYGFNGCTPYPMCVKSCANYLGQDISLDYTMVSSGAAFRLTWDTTSWNGGNVDVIHTFEEPEEVYKMGIEALGREFQILTRATNCDIKFNNSTKTDDKTEFKKFIKAQIDKGFPCIALGIIGPPEACIITGYRDSGEVLLGWNFFQDANEFSPSQEVDETGYFVTGKWWENESTVAVMSMGDIVRQTAGSGDIIKNAVRVMTGRSVTVSGRTFAKGIAAYDAWKNAILDAAEFPKNAVLPILAERIMCHGDAMDCLADGRHKAALYMKRISEELPEFNDACISAHEQFLKVTANIWKMAEVLGGYDRNELQMQNLAKPEVRQQLAELIDKCKKADIAALDSLKYIADHI